jgi:hypothetical protein
LSDLNIQKEKERFEILAKDGRWASD